MTNLVEETIGHPKAEYPNIIRQFTVFAAGNRVLQGNANIENSLIVACNEERRTPRRLSRPCPLCALIETPFYGRSPGTSECFWPNFALDRQANFRQSSDRSSPPMARAPNARSPELNRFHHRGTARAYDLADLGAKLLVCCAQSVPCRASRACCSVSEESCLLRLLQLGLRSDIADRS